MASWHQRLLPLAACITLIASNAAWAAPSAIKTDTTALSKDMDTQLDKLQKPTAQQIRDAAEERIRLQKITQDANAFSGMLASELALQRGNIGSAFGAYRLLFERTGRPELAERAMQIAIGAGAYNEAQLVLERWRKLEPEPTSLQQQMAWELDASRGNIGTALADFPAILSKADEAQARRIFLLLAQLSLAGPNVASDGYGSVVKNAKKYPDMPEAAVAEAMYAALSRHEKQAVSTLNRLAKLDADIRPTTQLAIGLLAQKAPQVVARFFSQADATQLSEIWRQLQIEVLVETEQYDQAYQLLQTELSQNPSPELHIKAGVLAMKKKNMVDAENFLTKAYQSGDNLQRNRAAILLSVMMFGQKQTDKGQQWAARVSGTEFQFDQAIILATAAAERNDWLAVRQHLDAAKGKIPASNGLFNNSHAQRLELLWTSNQTDPQAVYNEYSKQINAQLAKASPDTDLLAELYEQRGILLVDKLQRPEEAVQDFRRQLQLQPYDANAMNSLGYTLLMQAATRQQGFEWVERAYKLEPQAPHINDSLGWAYYLKGQPEKAEAYLKFAYDKMPDAEVAAHLVDVYMALQQMDKAKAFAQKGWLLNARHPILLETLRRHALLPASGGQ